MVVAGLKLNKIDVAQDLFVPKLAFRLADILPPGANLAIQKKRFKCCN